MRRHGTRRPMTGRGGRHRGRRCGWRWLRGRSRRGRRGSNSRCASSASQVTSRYGPLPIGALLNGDSSRSAALTSWRRWSGRSGCVAAWRKLPSGVARSKRTVRSSIAVTVTSRHDDAPGPVYDRVLQCVDRVDHVGRRHRLAVLPARVGSKLEGVRGALLVDRPAARRGRARPCRPGRAGRGR